MAIKNLKIEDLDQEAATQSRADVQPKKIEQYVEDMEAGDTFPPLVVYETADGRYLIVDGWHRLYAYIRLGQDRVTCDVRTSWEGDPEVEAFVDSLDWNRKHGASFTDADKRVAVEGLLDRGWAEASSREIARKVGCSKTLVNKIRAERKAPEEPEVEPVEEVAAAAIAPEPGPDESDSAEVAAAASASEEPAGGETSPEDEAFFAELDKIRGRSLPAPKPKNGRPVSTVKERKALRKAFGDTVRRFEVLVKAEAVTEEKADEVHHLMNELAISLKEIYG